MTVSKSTLKTCKKGHQFYKSSECPICPTCEKEILSLHGMGKSTIPTLSEALIKA